MLTASADTSSTMFAKQKNHRSALQ